MKGVSKPLTATVQVFSEEEWLQRHQCPHCLVILRIYMYKYGWHIFGGVHQSRQRK